MAVVFVCNWAGPENTRCLCLTSTQKLLGCCNIADGIIFDNFFLFDEHTVAACGTPRVPYVYNGRQEEASLEYSNIYDSAFANGAMGFCHKALKNKLGGRFCQTVYQSQKMFRYIKCTCLIFISFRSDFTALIFISAVKSLLLFFYFKNASKCQAPKYNLLTFLCLTNKSWLYR